MTKHVTNTKLTPEGRSRSAGAKQEFQLIAHLDCVFYKCASFIVIRSLQYLRQIWRCCVCIALRLLTPLNIVIRGGSWSIQISNRSCQMSKPTSRHVLCLAGNVLNQPIGKVCFWTVTDSPHSEIGQNYPCFYLRSGVLFLKWSQVSRVHESQRRQAVVLRLQIKICQYIAHQVPITHGCPSHGEFNCKSRSFSDLMLQLREYKTSKKAHENASELFFFIIFCLFFSYT